MPTLFRMAKNPGGDTSLQVRQQTQVRGVEVKPKKYMLVMFEITDDEPVEDLKASVPEAAYVGGTEGLTLVQVGTGEEVFLPYACWFDKQSSRSWNGPQ